MRKLETTTIIFHQMDLQEFSERCQETDNYTEEAKDKGVYFAGLSEETGEVLGKYKRLLREDEGVLTEQRRREICLELGDVLWYVVAIYRMLGKDINEAAQDLLDKLKSRKQRGKIWGQGDNR